MRFLVVLASIVLAVNAATDKEQWLEFKQTYGRDYRNLKEEQQRFTVFQKNLRTIEAHNEKYDKGESTYYLGVNKFADRTPEEIKAMLTHSAANRPIRNPIAYHNVSGLQAPSEVNWVSKGVVNAIKDQGDCGSCWAFSTIGSMEGVYAVRTGTLYSLSEQNLLDCDPTGDCDGGWMEDSFNYIRDYGIETESDYPYTAKEGSCLYDNSKSVVPDVAGFVEVRQDPSALLDAVANIGPIAVCVNGDPMVLYSGGIFDDSVCDKANLDHGVVVVGYGNENGVDYWLIRNSWGINWGDNGYIKIARTSADQCGVAEYGSYPYF